MAQVIILYKLKPGVTRARYEEWTRDVDYPAVRGLKRVKSFVKYRVDKKLMGEGEPSVQYAEVIDVPDLDGFLREDMGGPVIQKLMGEFMALVENPEFLVAETV